MPPSVRAARPELSASESYKAAFLASRRTNAKGGGGGGGTDASEQPDPSHLWKTIWPRSCLCVECGHVAAMGENFLGCLICDQVAHKSCQTSEDKVLG